MAVKCPGGGRRRSARTSPSTTPTTPPFQGTCSQAASSQCHLELSMTAGPCMHRQHHLKSSPRPSSPYAAVKVLTELHAPEGEHFIGACHVPLPRPSPCSSPLLYLYVHLSALVHLLRVPWLEHVPLDAMNAAGLQLGHQACSAAAVASLHGWNCLHRYRLGPFHRHSE